MRGRRGGGGERGRGEGRGGRWEGRGPSAGSDTGGSGLVPPAQRAAVHSGPATGGEVG